MNWIESLSTNVRHLPGFKNLSSVWDLLRPAYQKLVSISAGGRGLVRNVNGMDEIRILPQWRALPEEYEPEVWKMLLPQIRAGDCIADIGAHYGLYAIAFAKRVGPTGRVIAVEADPANAEVLRAHAKLNAVEAVVEVVEKALSDQEGEVTWHSQDMQSVAKPVSAGHTGPSVSMTTLDRIASERRVDVILVDIEGYEEPALRGARVLLRDPVRRPRLIVIEVHPYNWPLCGASSGSLIEFLHDCGYILRHLDGREVDVITEYGHIVAQPGTL
jgi:FkbM family methyltransferase